MMKNIEKKLKKLLNDAKSGLTDEDFNNADEHIKHGEYGVAFELICVQLYEHDAVIDIQLLNDIKVLASLMGFDDSAWDFLHEIIR